MPCGIVLGHVKQRGQFSIRTATAEPRSGRTGGKDCICRRYIVDGGLLETIEDLGVGPPTRHEIDDT
jgi:hypothetical protein